MKNTYGEMPLSFASFLSSATDSLSYVLVRRTDDTKEREYGRTEARARRTVSIAGCLQVYTRNEMKMK